MKSVKITIEVLGDSHGFRFVVLQKALALGINGYVMRLGINDFEIVAESDEVSLNKFVQWFDEGYHWTNIVSGKIENTQWQGFNTFEMRSNPNLPQKVLPIDSFDDEDEKENNIFSVFVNIFKRR